MSRTRHPSEARLPELRPPLDTFAPFIHRSHHIRPQRPNRNLHDNWFDPTYTLVTCMAGSLRLIRDKEALIVREGRCALGEPGWRPRPGPRCRALLLNFDLVARGRLTASVLAPDTTPQPTWSTLFGVPQPALIPEHLTTTTTHLIHRLAGTYAMGWWHHLASNLQLGEWILAYARHLGAGPDAPRPDHGDDTDLAGLVDRLIYQHLSDGLTTSDLVSLCRVPRQTLDRRYRAARGTSVRVAIDAERDRRARDLLATTTQPVVDIADMVGFDAANAFCAWFRRRHGVTPGEWRLRQRLR